MRPARGAAQHRSYTVRRHQGRAARHPAASTGEPQLASPKCTCHKEISDAWLATNTGGLFDWPTLFPLQVKDATNGRQAFEGWLYDIQVVNMVGSEAVQALICQSVLYSRALLRCAALREVCINPCHLRAAVHIQA